MPSKLVSTDHDFQGINRAVGLPDSSSAGHPLVHGQTLPLKSISFASLPTNGLPPVAIAWCPDFQYGTPATSWAGPIAWNGTEWVPLYAGSLPAATVAGQPLNFSQGVGGATDWANPGAIGSNAKNTGAFTTISGSRYVVPTPIAGGTTLTKADHVGNAVKVEGGAPINLPVDASWDVGDEIEFLATNANPTTIQWVGNAIISADTGSAVSQIISGGIGTAAIVKKMAPGIAHLFSGASSLNGLTDAAIANAARNHTLLHDGTQFVNTPAILSLDDKKDRAWVFPSGGTPSQVGILLTTVGTFNHPQPAAGSAYTRANRFTIASGTTAGNLCSMRSATLRMFGGSNANEGGWEIVMPFGLAGLQAGQRAFAGVSSATATATNVDPLTTTANSKIGVACAANTGNWALIHNLAGAAPTQIPLGASFPIDITTWYELRLQQLPGAATVNYWITNKNTNTLAQGVLSTNLPANTTYMHLYTWMTNNATAAAVTMTFGKISMEFGV